MINLVSSSIPVNNPSTFPPCKRKATLQDDSYPHKIKKSCQNSKSSLKKVEHVQDYRRFGSELLQQRKLTQPLPVKRKKTQKSRPKSQIYSPSVYEDEFESPEKPIRAALGEEAPPLLDEIDKTLARLIPSMPLKASPSYAFPPQFDVC